LWGKHQRQREGKIFNAGTTLLKSREGANGGTEPKYYKKKEEAQKKNNKKTQKDVWLGAAR